MRYIQYVETPEGSALLSRPVMEVPVPTKPDVPATTSVSQHTGRSIQLRAPSEWEQNSVCGIPADYFGFHSIKVPSEWEQENIMQYNFQSSVSIQLRSPASGNKKNRIKSDFT
ncbi:MAG: hypothetical protein ACKPB9_18985, partial [Dolichospermum sp.]